MSELEQYIGAYFEGITENEIATVASLFQLEQLKKGDFYLKEGKSCDKLSFISSGILRIYKTLDDKEVTQWISTQGYFVTDLASLIFRSPARWSIYSLTDTTLYTINRTDYNLLHTIVPRWAEIEKLFLAKCFVTLEERVFSHLSLSAEERYNLFFEQNRELFNQIPLQYLASMLGMTPETFSRIRKKSLR
ncbi:MAG: Crp/Fnr family transcriptional regulator [Bacteroidales bacterium]|nr:Crp/Fnr family transcriptional regulator [Bacteroidales bacterium]